MSPLSPHSAPAESMLGNLGLLPLIGLDFTSVLVTFFSGYWFSGPQDVIFFRSKIASLCPSHESHQLLTSHKDIVVPFHLSPNSNLNTTESISLEKAPKSEIIEELTQQANHSNHTHHPHPMRNHRHHPNHTVLPTNTSRRPNLHFSLTISRKVSVISPTL